MNTHILSTEMLIQCNCAKKVRLQSVGCSTPPLTRKIPRVAFDVIALAHDQYAVAV